MAINRFGHIGRIFFTMMAVANVTMAIPNTYIFISPKCVPITYHVSLNEMPPVICNPNICFNWLVAMSKAAPAVNPITTECDTKFMSVPIRDIPSTNWISPAIKVRVRASRIKSADAGSANWLIAAKTTMEIAVVGPEIRCLDDPKSAATTGVTIAVYNPYTGGIPAIMAKATP